jgi:hypothetical protein
MPDRALKMGKCLLHSRLEVWRVKNYLNLQLRSSLTQICRQGLTSTTTILFKSLLDSSSSATLLQRYNHYSLPELSNVGGTY